MAQLAVAVVGAGIGFAIGGPAGAKWGWMIGSTAGAIAFAPSGPDGPRVTDGKFTANVYGEPIPLSYGTMRHVAHVLWWSGLHEHRHRVGRNLFSRGVTTYTYTCDVLLSVCAGPQGAVLRIWANGRLIWTNDGTPQGRVDGEVLQPGSVRVYLGTEDQLPDPTYEAAVGAENAVPYRGEVVVAIDGLELEFAGNRPPQFEVEVTQVVEAPSCPVDIYAETPAAGEVMFLSPSHALHDGANMGVYDSRRGVLWIATRAGDGSVWQLEGYGTHSFPPELVETVTLPVTWDVDNDSDYMGLAYDPEHDHLWIIGGTSDRPAEAGKPVAYIKIGSLILESVAKISMSSGDFDNGTGAQGGLGAYYGTLPAIYPALGIPLGEVGSWGPGSAFAFRRYFRLRNYPISDVDVGYGWYDESSEGRTNYAQVVYYVPYPWGLNIVCTGDLDSDAEYIDRNAIVTEIGNRVNAPPSQDPRVAHSVRRKRAWVMRGRWLAELDLTEPLSYATPFVQIPSVITGLGKHQLVYDEVADHLVIFAPSATTLHVWTLDPETYAVRMHCTGTWPSGRTLRRPYNVGPGEFIASVGTSASSYGVAALRAPGGTQAAGNPTTLRYIVEDVCRRSGLPPANLDATEGTDLVWGFKVARQTTARAVIQSLQPAYFFDMPESGAQLVLRKRGGAPVATIDSGELGARIVRVTETDPPPPYELEHVEEVEAPRVLELTYIDPTANYDPGLQRAERQAGTSHAPASLEVPVSLTAMEAARIAYANLMHAHASKDPIRLNLPHKFAALEPSDPIIVPLSSGPRRVRIESVTRAHPLVELTGVLEEEVVYEQLAGGVPRYNDPTQTDALPTAATVLELLDLPPLLDADDMLLLYVAMGPGDPELAWPGATLYKSIDSGTSYEPYVDTAVPCTMGATVTALPSWPGGNRWDRVSTVDVLLSSGEFESATELAVLNGANLVLIGTELVQFTTATLVADDTWRLSGLLRGRKGTEYAIAGHAAGERVVLLDDALLAHAPGNMTELGAARHYKGVTANQPVANAPAQAFALAGNSIKPISPVHIGASRAGGDLTITWVPRVRIDPYLRSGVAVSLDEPVEAYEIDILDGGTVVRTLSASSPSVVYTAAQQASDFGSAPAEVDVAIYQISTRAGRGHAGVATV